MSSRSRRRYFKRFVRSNRSSSIFSRSNSNANQFVSSSWRRSSFTIFFKYNPLCLNLHCLPFCTHAWALFSHFFPLSEAWFCHFWHSSWVYHYHFHNYPLAPGCVAHPTLLSLPESILRRFNRIFHHSFVVWSDHECYFRAARVLSLAPPSRLVWRDILRPFRSFEYYLV